jgi:hypothetical protein
MFKKTETEKIEDARMSQHAKDKRFYESRIDKMKCEHVDNINKVHEMYRKIIKNVKKEKDEERKIAIDKAIEAYKRVVLKRDNKIKKIENEFESIKEENKRLLYIYDKYEKLRDSLVSMSRTADLSVTALKELIPRIIAEFGKLSDSADIHMDLVKHLSREFEEMERLQIEGEDEFLQIPHLKLINNKKEG